MLVTLFQRGQRQLDQWSESAEFTFTCSCKHLLSHLTERLAHPFDIHLQINLNTYDHSTSQTIYSWVRIISLADSSWIQSHASPRCLQICSYSTNSCLIDISLLSSRYNVLEILRKQFSQRIAVSSHSLISIIRNILISMFLLSHGLTEAETA